MVGVRGITIGARSMVGVWGGDNTRHEKHDWSARDNNRREKHGWSVKRRCKEKHECFNIEEGYLECIYLQLGARVEL